MIQPQAQKIQSMFAEISENYDRANDFLSLGIHHSWRKKLIQLSGAQVGESVLDCATGTGDLALEFKKYLGDSSYVVGSDFCQEMLTHAPGKARSLNLNVTFEWADVTQLPYAERSFDIVSIAFGIRNVENRRGALQEMYRVLKPGGRLMILEFGQPRNALFSKAYHFYSKNILPVLGGLITGRKEAYQYLEASSAEFPCRQDFLMEVASAAPFRETKYYSLSGGIAYIYKLLK